MTWECLEVTNPRYVNKVHVAPPSQCHPKHPDHELLSHKKPIMEVKVLNPNKTKHIHQYNLSKEQNVNETKILHRIVMKLKSESTSHNENYLIQL